MAVLCSLVSGCASAESWQEAPSAPLRNSEAAEPLAALARLVGASWRVELHSGATQDDTWSWGPGRFSLRATTVDSAGSGETTSGLQRFIYWHPGTRSLRSIGVSRGDRLWEGTVAVDAAQVLLDQVLHYPDQPSRQLGLRWRFDGPDSYRSELFEKLKNGRSVSMTDWPYQRVAVEHAAGAHSTPPRANASSDWLAQLEGDWRSSLVDANGQVSALHTRVRRVPHTQALLVQVEAAPPGGTLPPELDALVFHDPALRRLRCLVLTRTGAVGEGEHTPLPDNPAAFRIRWFDGDSEATIGARWSRSAKGELRVSIASEDIQIPASVEETRHTPVAPPAPPRLRFEKGVRAILEDRSGHLWFGSHEEGLARYDGAQFTYFTTEDGLAHRQVRSLHLGPDGSVWIEGGRGVSRFDGARVSAHAHRVFGSTNSSRLDGGELWFKGDEETGYGTQEAGPGAYRLDGEQRTWLRFPLSATDDNSARHSVTGLSRGANGRVWFATYAAVVGFDGERFTVLDDARLGRNDENGRLHVRSVLEDREGRLWIGNNGIGVLLREGEKTTDFGAALGAPRAMRHVFALAQDRSGHIWIGTRDDGAFRYDGVKLEHFGPERGLESKHVWTFYVDPRGVLWSAGASPSGVFRFDGSRFERAF